MTNLSKGLREKLAGETEYTVLKPVEILTSEIDGTQKYLFELKDGNVIESVLMKYHHGNSVCISSQVGCRMGCRFCASTIGGKKRDLTASEMLEEVYEIQKISGERVSNLVLMGTGEPLDNYDNVRKFIELLTDENGLHISQRNVTLSTCGIVPNIRSFRSRWRSLFTRRARRKGKNLCLLRSSMSFPRSWTPAGIIMIKPDGD